MDHGSDGKLNLHGEGELSSAHIAITYTMDAGYTSPEKLTPLGVIELQMANDLLSTSESRRKLRDETNHTFTFTPDAAELIVAAMRTAAKAHKDPLLVKHLQAMLAEID